MADFKFVTENLLTLESNKKKRNSRLGVFVIGCILAVALLFVIPVASPVVLFFTAVALMRAKGDEVLLAGAAGENLALQLLKGLPDSFTVFNQVNLPNPKSRTGYNEADIIVVGPEAVFVVEVKQ